MPIPNRVRPISKYPRKKPPSYELTSNATMEYVQERIPKPKTKKPRIEKVKEDKKGKGKSISRKKAKPNIELGASLGRSGAASSFHSPNENCDIRSPSDASVACQHCKGLFGDEANKLYDSTWIACSKCANWYHEPCAEQSGLLDDDEFICQKCYC